MWSDKRYHSLDYELKKIFGEKAIKLSIDGNFTCPNRDGTIDTKGCIFCSERGSGEFTYDKNMSISSQIQHQKIFMSKKWISNSYIAYFQNYTNTYDSVENLRIKFYEAISCKDIKCLAIATRPDCITPEIVHLLKEVSLKTFLWIEIGLQTIHDDTSKLIRRGYDLQRFEYANQLLSENNIRTVVHLIMGLPSETKDHMLESVRYVSHLKPWGVKLHLLHVLKNTDLAKYYDEVNFTILTEEQYVDIICDALEILPADTIIHRVTGDGKKSDLIVPLWSLNKLKVLSSIDLELKKRDSFQGKNYLL